MGGGDPEGVYPGAVRPLAAAHTAVRTIRLDLAYDGTAYAGFGIQPGRSTIQEVLEGALGRVLGRPIRVTVAGRTDAGVHASGQVVSFATAACLEPDVLARAANAHLPEDIVIERASEASADFDARRSARRRHYRYSVWNRPSPNLWRRHWSWHVRQRLDVAAMNRAAAELVGQHDFAAFAGRTGREPARRSTVRTVVRAGWCEEDGLLSFDIAADGFLRQMVRGIVGTLIWVGQGRIEPPRLQAILAGADRRQAGPNAPPRGLMLVGVDYGGDRSAASYPTGTSHRCRAISEELSVL